HRRLSVVGFIGVPAVVADRQRGPVYGIAVLVEIRDHVSSRKTLCLSVSPAVALDLPKIGYKLELLFPAQHLFGEHQNAMDAKRLADLLPPGWRQRHREVDAGDRDAAGFRQRRTEDATHFPPRFEVHFAELARTTEKKATALLNNTSSECPRQRPPRIRSLVPSAGTKVEARRSSEQHLLIGRHPVNGFIRTLMSEAVTARHVA